MNFTYTTEPPPDNAWGGLQPDGTWNGMMRLVTDEIKDFGKILTYKTESKFSPRSLANLFLIFENEEHRLQIKQTMKDEFKPFQEMLDKKR